MGETTNLHRNTARKPAKTGTAFFPPVASVFVKVLNLKESIFFRAQD
jgi:hypothetical protein